MVPRITIIYFKYQNTVTVFSSYVITLKTHMLGVLGVLIFLSAGWRQAGFGLQSETEREKLKGLVSEHLFFFYLLQAFHIIFDVFTKKTIAQREGR